MLLVGAGDYVRPQHSALETLDEPQLSYLVTKIPPW